MPYATLQDLLDRFGEDELLQVADRDDDGVIDTAVADSALKDAEELIDSYIARRYRLPLASVPASLVRATANIARYFLYKDEPTEAAQKGYDQAITWLKDIAAGRALLDAEGSEPASSSAGEPRVIAPGRTFTDDTLGSYVDGRRRG